MNHSPAPEPTPDEPALSIQLRERTGPAHQDAERRHFNRSLARGELTPADWRRHLEQHLILHQALERRIDQLTRESPRWLAELAGPERRRVPDLAADLAALAGNPAAAPLPPTAAAVAAIAGAPVAEVIGYLYVLEGSTNGGRFLVRSARRFLGTPPESRDGLRFLDPYGEEQPERWRGFREALDRLDRTGPETDSIVAGAERMFHWVASIADAVWAARAEPAA
ncbi:MAG: biliverdin-producing heme oxygenase [Gemmatimonadales bacterium]